MFYCSLMTFYCKKIFRMTHLKWLKQTNILTIFQNEYDQNDPKWGFQTGHFAITLALQTRGFCRPKEISEREGERVKDPMNHSMHLPCRISRSLLFCRTLFALFFIFSSHFCRTFFLSLFFAFQTFLSSLFCFFRHFSQFFRVDYQKYLISHFWCLYL